MFLELIRFKWLHNGSFINTKVKHIIMVNTSAPVSQDIEKKSYLTNNKAKEERTSHRINQ